MADVDNVFKCQLLNTIREGKKRISGNYDRWFRITQYLRLKSPFLHDISLEVLNELEKTKDIYEDIQELFKK